MFAELASKGLAKRLFEDFVLQCKKEGIIDGSHVAIDSAAIHAYEMKQPKRKSERTGNANWGAKFDSFGNKVKWFGYKLHLAVDTASATDGALRHASSCQRRRYGSVTHRKVAAGTKVKFFILDAGYDQLKNYDAARNVKAQAIIPMVIT
ncbi:transposase [Paenibacillus bouchesdurhonensis]|uniref:transposase n=1 Tax=Paenibacillus bouchesdurhonensis TaxID=1870990 RepID=UPI0038991605